MYPRRCSKFCFIDPSMQPLLHAPPPVKENNEAPPPRTVAAAHETRIGNGVVRNTKGALHHERFVLKERYDAEDYFEMKEELMSQIIEVSVDNKGCIRSPPDMQDRLGLSPGMTLLVEKGEQGELCLCIPKDSPMLIDKEGVLVVKAETVGHIEDIVQQERNRRILELVERTGL